MLDDVGTDHVDERAVRWIDSLLKPDAHDVATLSPPVLDVGHELVVGGAIT